MMKLSARILSAFAGLILIVFGLMGAGGVHAQSTDPIGLILSTSGSVRAEDSQGNVRRLQRRSPVFEGDTLITGNRSRAQIRFNDNGLIALNPNTSFVVEEHKFSGQEDGQESATYRLVRGGLQAITGLIGHTNKDRYRVNTPLATIGLRGTHWAATFCDSTCDGNPPGLYGGVADGGIDVCNAGGCTPIDQDGYFYTPDANTKPATLLAAPSVVFSDTEETDDGSGDPDDASGDEADEGGEVADADDESDSSTTAPEDTETFVAEVLGTTDSDAGDTTGTSQTIEDDLAQSPSTGDDEQLVLETDDGDSLLLDDLNNGDVPDGDEPGDGEPVDEVVLEDNEVSNPAIEQVSAGAAGALASHIGTQDGSQSDSINVVVVPGSNDTDRLFTTQLDLDGDESDDATALAALDFEDPNGSGCDPLCVRHCAR